MTKVGPFWRERPSTSATQQDWGWCFIYLGRQGQIVAIEWLS